MKKVFIVVGHSNWGKSKTIKNLIHPKLHGFFNIKKYKIFSRNMSNDDESEKLLNFIKKLDTTKKSLLVMTLCPNFENENRNTKKILEILQNKKYEIYFFILKNKYLNPINKITEKEIDKLKKYSSNFEILNKNYESNIRANKLKKFIIKNLKE
jgi:hypothetical protein